MKLEKIYKDQNKIHSGIIGQTRKNNFVTKWELVYHDVNFYRVVT